MSTRSTELAQPFAGARGVPWRSFFLAFALTVLALLVFGAVFAVALVSLDAGKIVPGTVVAGVPLGGLDRPSAEVRLREQLPSLSSGHISVNIGGVEKRIEYASIGRDYDYKQMLDQALAVGRDGDVLSQAQEQLRVALRGASVDPQVTWNEAALETQFNQLALSVEMPAVDATIVRSGAKFGVTPSAEGTTVNVQAAWQQALATVATLSPADTSVSISLTPQPPTVTTDQAQLAVNDLERVVGADLTLSGDGITQTITSDTIRGWVRLEPAGAGQWTVVVEQDPIAQEVALMSASVYKAPVDASFKFSGGSPVAVPGTTGRQLDVSTTSQAVYNALVGRITGPAVNSVALTINSVDPSFTTAQAVALAPKVQILSTWTTGFLPSDHNFFGANITIPALIINGTVVPAGQKFDFWATVGDLSQVPGIGPGGVIIHGHTDPTGALGGGICSCSTTLWNAAMRAGLAMGARQNHAYYINRYPTGLDATVWKSGTASQDMTFTNDLAYPIIIRGIKGTSSSACIGEAKEFGRVDWSNCVIFQIWGIPSGRTVSFSKPVITNMKVATDMMVYANVDPNGKPLLPGQLFRTEFPVDGFHSVVVRTVRDSSGNIIHQDTIVSTYVKVIGITLIGRAPTDPPAGKTFPNPNPFPNFFPPGAPSPH